MTDHQKLALKAAVSNNNFKNLKELIDQNIDLNQDLGEGNTALHIAAQKGFYLLAYILVIKGADIHAKNKYYVTPLEYAVSSCCQEIVILLVSRGAKVTQNAILYSQRKGLAGIYEIMTSQYPLQEHITPEINWFVFGGVNQERYRQAANNIYQNFAEQDGSPQDYYIAAEVRRRVERVQQRGRT